MEVVEAHRKYFCFDGPYVFFKFMQPLVKLWRSKGLKAVMYLYNGTCAVKGKIEAKKASAWVRDALECAGNGVLVCVLCTIPAYWSIDLCAVYHSSLLEYCVYHSSLLEYWSVCCVPFQPIGV